MKILHLSSERTWRGGEQQIAYLIEESLKKGIEIIVACRIGSEFEAYCLQQQLKHISLPFKGQFSLSTVFGIKKICKKEKIDFVHCHSSHSHALAVWAAVIGNKTPIILSRRVDFPIKKNRISQFKYNHSNIKSIICVSHAIEEIIKPDIKNTSIVTTVHSGIDVHKFDAYTNTQKLHQEYQLPTKTKIIGNISALAPHKDYYTFIDTAEKVIATTENTYFFAIGDGPEGENLKTYADTKDLKNRFIFTGFRTDIQEIIKELDVFLMTSTTEGLGTTQLDAMSCGLPIVATKAGGIPEIVHHKKTGLLANIKDSDGLADNILTLLADQTLYNQITVEQLSFVQQFSKEQTAAKTINIYQSL